MFIQRGNNNFDIQLADIPVSPFVNTYSLDFDGTDDRVQLSSDFVASGEFTLSFWMKPVAVTGNGNIFPIGTFPDNQNHVRLDQIGVIYLKVQAVLCLFNEGVVGGGANNLVLNEWQHISFIRDSSNIITCYRNGAIFGATVTNSGTLTLNSIGRVIANTFGFQGGLDEIAFWNTDETANISTLSTSPTVDLTDLSPTIWLRNGDNGAYKSPQWLIPNNENNDKVSNYSFEFDGIGDYVELGSLSNLQNATEYSVSSWFKSPLNNLYQAIWSWFDGADGYLQLLLISDGSFVVYNYRTSQAYGLSATGLVSADTWYNALVVFDGGGATNADRLKLYINGNPITLTYTGTIPTQTGTMLVNTMWLGASNSPNFWGLEGNIDEVSIFDSAISIGDVWDGSGEPTDVSAVSGLMQYYKMGEEANFTSNWLVDNSALDNYSKRSFAFDGVDDKVEIGTQSLGITGAISVSAWVKIPTSNTGGGGTNIQYFVGEDRTNLTNRNWVLNWRGGGLNRISGVIFDSGGTAVAATTNAIVPNDGNWHHVMFTYTGDTSTDGLKLFVDGIQRAQGTSSNGGTRSTTAVVPTIGGISQGIANMFEGNIDEVSIFNTDQSANVSTIYNGGIPNDLTDLSPLHWYRMGEDASFNGTNWTVPDNVGTNTGTSDAMTVDALVGEAPNYSGGGISNGMTIEDRVGEAPSSENNALSFNMESVDRTTDVPT